MAFKKGQSGNPAGRSPGSTPAAKLKKIIADNMPEILASLIEQAKLGDTSAAKALMDKVIPSLKSQALPVSIAAEEGLNHQGQAVIAATLAGTIPPNIGAALITALSNQAKLVEFEEMSQRLVRIEQKLEARNESAAGK